MFGAHLFKLIKAPYLYIGFIGVLALSFYSMNRSFGNNVFTNLLALLDLESFCRMFVICAAIPFTANFAEEWNSMTIAGCITRKNVLKYSVSNVAVCFISAFATVFLGLMICVFANLISDPPFDSMNPVGSPYGELFRTGAVLLPFLFTAIVFALSCGMWSVMGLTLSAFFPSKFVAVCSPFVFCYVIERCTRMFPEEFDLHALSRSASSHNAAFTVLWASAVFLAVSLFCGIIFTLAVKRRVENELS